MEMTYQAIFDRAGDGTIWGRIPEMPGAYGCGATIDEARESLIEGARIHMEEMRKDGIEIPIPTTLAVVPIHLDAA
jgi:predicted RNase H-like HicB family nuclease